MNCKLIESEERLLMLVKGEMTGKGAALLGVSELKKQKLERKKKKHLNSCSRFMSIRQSGLRVKLAMSENRYLR